MSVISGPLPSSGGVLPTRSASGTSPSGRRNSGSAPVGTHQSCPGRLVDAAAGDQDEVTGRTAPPAIHLAQEALGPGSLNRAPDLPARHHPEPGRCAAVARRQPDRHQVRSDAPRPRRHHGAEIGRPRDPLLPRERLIPTGANTRWRRRAAFTHDETPQRSPVLVRARRNTPSGRSERPTVRQADSLRRPRRRRRAMTARPPGVLIRARKPCFRFLRRLLG